MYTIHDVLDKAVLERSVVPPTILSYVGLDAKASVADTCKALANMMRDGVFWTTLDFRGTKNYSNTLAAALKHSVVASNVEEVNLEFCKETNDRDLALLADLGARFEGSRLTHLNLNALHKLSDDAIVAVATSHSASLQALQLYWHHSITNTAVVNIAKGCPNLTLLNLSGCQKLEDSGVRAIARSCGKSLTSLDLTRCPLLTDDALEFAAPRLPNLVSLNLYADSQFSDRGYLALAQLHHLTFLDLCGATKLSSKACATIANGCPNMRSWNLSWCVPVDDAAIAVIAANCRRLELLSVFGLLGVTDASLDALAKGGLGKTLHTLDVHGCRNVTRQADQLLLKQFPRLTCFSHHS